VAGGGFRRGAGRRDPGRVNPNILWFPVAVQRRPRGGAGHGIDAGIFRRQLYNHLKILLIFLSSRIVAAA
jgi:hypothetical protein